MMVKSDEEIELEIKLGNARARCRDLERQRDELQAKNAELLLKLTKALKKVADLNVRQKRLVEIILSEVEYYQPNGEYMPETEAFYCDGVVYGMEKAAEIVKAALKEKADE